MGLESIEAQKKNTLIATYGKEREFYIEDQRREWYNQLNTIYTLARDSMEAYMYPQGPVISYGWSIENRIGVGILEGSEVNNSIISDIYNIFDQTGKGIGVDNVPVIFSYIEFPVDEETLPKIAEDIEKTEESVEAEETNKTDERSAEDVREPVSTPGLGIRFILGVLISALIINRY